MLEFEDWQEILTMKEPRNWILYLKNKDVKNFILIQGVLSHQHIIESWEILFYGEKLFNLTDNYFSIYDKLNTDFKIKLLVRSSKESFSTAEEAKSRINKFLNQINKLNSFI